MKNIEFYDHNNYKGPSYIHVSNKIYQKDGVYVTCLRFEQEPDYGEGYNSSSISQYPLEDILDKFSVYITNFYKKENSETDSKCLLEFGSKCLNNIIRLLSIEGKHVYNATERAGMTEYIVLKIE